MASKARRMAGTQSFTVVTSTGGSKTATFTNSFPAGIYTIESLTGDADLEIYLGAEDGTNVGYVTGGSKAITASAPFKYVTTANANSSDAIIFSLFPTSTNATTLATKTDAYWAPPTITDITPSGLANINSTTTITGTNFASNVDVKFRKSDDATLVNAKTIVRGSATSIIAGRPDSFTPGDAPYDVVVTNPSTTLSAISLNAITSGAVPVWVTSTTLNVAQIDTAFSQTIQATDADGSSTITYAIVSGALQTGLSLNTSTGAIAGTPTGSDGSTTIVISATDSGGNTVNRTFTQVVNPSALTVNYLVVGGAGGGAFGGGGGGGAGGFRTGTLSAMPLNTKFPVIIGSGGAGGLGNTGRASNGGNSIFSSIVSAGGGRGAVQYAGNGWESGTAGGSGGGGGAPVTSSGSLAGGAGNTPSTSPSQGNNGGAGVHTSSVRVIGGGGGGASAVGADAVTNAGAGGAGTSNSISGTSVTYAGGGGGGAYVTGSAGAGGAGGGGAGSSSGNGTAGTANLGGGGGGGTYSANGAAGGSGIVILSYAGSQRAYGGTVTSSGGNTIHTFTSSGNFETGLTVNSAKATGGTIMSDGVYWYHAFTSGSSTFAPNQNLTADILIVAGGGGGGGRRGGGGGAGGLVYATSQSLTVQNYTAVVGAGGAGGSNSSGTGSDGGASSFTGLTSATGGGGGRNDGGGAGRAGGSGGGGSSGAGGSQTSGQGNAGGSGADAPNYGGGGGGGAGSAGSNGTGTTGGNGGAGTNTYSSILNSVGYGVNGYIAAGGGGGVYNGGTAGNGGTGGGASASPANSDATGFSAENNTGGGGGGGSMTAAGGAGGGSGGSGIVIIRYAV